MIKNNFLITEMNKKVNQVTPFYIPAETALKKLRFPRFTLGQDKDYTPKKNVAAVEGVSRDTITRSLM